MDEPKVKSKEVIWRNLNIVPDTPEDYIKYKYYTNRYTSNLMLGYAKHLISECIKTLQPADAGTILVGLNERASRAETPQITPAFKGVTGLDGKATLDYITNLLLSKEMESAIYHMFNVMYDTADRIELSRAVLCDSPLHIMNIYEPNLLGSIEFVDTIYIDAFHTLLDLKIEEKIDEISNDGPWKITIKEFLTYIADFNWYMNVACTMAIPASIWQKVTGKNSVVGGNLEYMGYISRTKGTMLAHATYITSRAIMEARLSKLVTADQRSLIKWACDRSLSIDQRVSHREVVTYISDLLRKESFVPHWVVHEMGIPGADEIYKVQIWDPKSNAYRNYVYGSDKRWHVGNEQGKVAGESASNVLDKKYGGSNPLTKWRRSKFEFETASGKNIKMIPPSEKIDAKTIESKVVKQGQRRITHDISKALTKPRVGELMKAPNKTTPNRLYKMPPLKTMKKMGWISLALAGLEVGNWVYKTFIEEEDSNLKVWPWGDDLNNKKSERSMAIMVTGLTSYSLPLRTMISNASTVSKAVTNVIKERNGHVLVSDQAMLMDLLLNDWFKQEIGKGLYNTTWLHFNCLELIDQITTETWTSEIKDLYIAKEKATIPALLDWNMWNNIVDTFLSEFIGVQAIGGVLLEKVDVQEILRTTVSSLVDNVVDELLLSL